MSNRLIQSPDRTRAQGQLLATSEQSSVPANAPPGYDPDDKSANGESSASSHSQVVGLGFSLVLHLVLLTVLAFIVFEMPGQKEVLSLLVETSDRSDGPTEMVTTVELPSTENLVEADIDSLALSRELTMESPQLTAIEPELFRGPAMTLAGVPQVDVSSDFGGRSSQSREKLVQLFGGTPASEAAVERGLQWLAARQRVDGSWSFDHRRPRQRHRDHQAGSLTNCPIGATALALMAFLGAGHTHQSGLHQQEVKDGLEFLLQSAVQVSNGADLRGRENGQVAGGSHTMYAHGLATIALSECYAMTRDRRARLVAQEAINFIVDTRNREVGGWRYSPKQAGDLSVTGWMIMALQSGKTAGLHVPDIAWENSMQFLDATAQARGSEYGYTAGGAGKPATSAIGLLCRMYLGWDQENPALRAGVIKLGELGPSRSNMYYNYYATQVLHHHGGQSWTAWNNVMRDYLVDTQLKKGPEAGSWNVTDPHGDRGGRLYQTTLSIMTLEVYYRHLPLYQLRTDPLRTAGE